MSVPASRISPLIALLFSFWFCPVSWGGFDSPHRRESASVKTTPRDTILKISERIDELVAQNLLVHGQNRNEQSTDEVFLRRAYLSIVGRIPTLGETTRFLNLTTDTKRADLIDELLDSYGYVSHQFNFWADLLRIQTRMQGNLTGQSYVDFVKDSLGQNVPYDEFVQRLITSQGPNLERANGAVGFYLRDRNMPEDNMSNTIRVFLGTRLECAQCHDHPFDKWTQRQYFEMVAFTGGIRYRSQELVEKFKSLRNAGTDELSAEQRKVLQDVIQAATYGIEGSGTGLARLPDEYTGDDGYGGEIVVAKELFQSTPLTQATVPLPPKKNAKRVRKPNKQVQQAAIPGAREIGSREIYAQWLTSSDNPRFATVIANRFWKQTMGVGLIEPLDVIEENTVASNPELMEYLAATMIELDFDLKQFLRAIYNSQTWQAAGYSTDVDDPHTFYFNGPLVRRLSAEQIWDSLLVLAEPNVDQRSNPIEKRLGNFASDLYEAFEKIRGLSPAELIALIPDLEKANRRQLEDRKNNPEFKRLAAERDQIGKQIQLARRTKDDNRLRELRLQQSELMREFRQISRQNQAYSRASEMVSPAKPGHFLREFGQSDREQIDNFNCEPAVTQVLNMMNGLVEKNIARDSGSPLLQAVAAAESPRDCVDTIFLAMLNRPPATAELQLWEPDFETALRSKDNIQIKDVSADLIWVLANSNEFIFLK